MAEGVGVEIWGAWPQLAEDARAALWPEVNVVVALHADRSADAEMLAAKRVVLPRVPVSGEQVEVAGRWAVVEQVRWERKLPPTVRVQPLITVPGLSEALEGDGFRLIGRGDADDELSRLLD